MKQAKFKYLLFFTLILGLFILISLNRDSKVKIFTYQSELWSDKAGYNIYLPYLLLYNCDANSLPDSIIEKTGFGFKIDKGNNVVQTKYTYGTALMQSPFYIASLVAFNQASPFKGFTKHNQISINLAACFYAALALLMLFDFCLKKGLTSNTALITISSFFLSTNLFYFALHETGMSHIYSFFAFTLVIWSSELVNKSVRQVLLGLGIGLIIILRPYNVLFIPILLSINSSNFKQFFKRIIALVNIKSILIIICLVIPQLIYWKHAYGQYLHYSYADEGFTNILHPPLLKFLFSPNNGLIFYAPILLVFIYSLFNYNKYNNFNCRFLVIGLICFTFLTSSWWSWQYGCSYGCRPFVEFFGICILPLGYKIQNLSGKLHKLLFFSLLLILALINLKFIYSSDNCWFYGDWDYKMYLITLFGPTH